MEKSFYLGLSLMIVFGCSQNFEKIYDCDGVEVIFNDYDRLFVVGGVELSQKDGFFMNQTTIVGKFYTRPEGSAYASFNKINESLEFKDPSQKLSAKCIELSK
tara:strand:+ start:274 stop:582 length:309 start_codon:yes stop_codon:yes gene_type:complete